MDRKENIRNAYRLTGSNNFYDGMITCSTVSGKAVCRLVWDMGKEECDEYLNKAFTGVPEDFAGKPLEVPVGTGILTMPLYQTLPRADITCLDYSPDMMGQAREKTERMALQNVQFRQGDVGALPYEDALISCCRSTASTPSPIRRQRTARRPARCSRAARSAAASMWRVSAEGRTDS